MSYYTCALQITEGLYCIITAVSGLYYYPLITRHTSAVYYGSDHGQSSQCLSIPAALRHVSEVSCFAKDSGLVYFWQTPCPSHTAQIQNKQIKTQLQIFNPCPLKTEVYWLCMKAINKQLNWTEQNHLANLPMTEPPKSRKTMLDRQISWFGESSHLWNAPSLSWHRVEEETTPCWSCNAPQTCAV